MQTYLCKFDSEGRRGETLLTCEYSDEEKQQKIAEGYIEISEEDWNYYVGNKGQSKNGTGYIRGVDGKLTDAPVYVPTKEEKLMALDSKYNSNKAELAKYFTDALLADDTDTQKELQAELLKLDADYKQQRKTLENN